MRILHLYPDLMNLYGDYGNITVLKRHLEDQGVKVTVDKKDIDEVIDFSKYDFIYMGSGTENNQKLALDSFKKYENMFKIYLNKGPVLKHSFSQTYIESPKAAALFRKYCSENSVPFQEFVNRNDLRGGSTVGPASAASIGAAGFDIGNAIFSMHSIREFGGTYDVKYATDFFKAFHR